MNAPDVLVVSGRRLLADAYVGVLTKRACSIGVCGSVDEASRRVAANSTVTVLFDLDPLPGSTSGVTSALHGHLGRRCGFYDRFTADIAQLTFELGVRSLIASSAPVDEIRRSVLGDIGTVITSTQGLTRNELDRLGRLSDREFEVLELVARGYSASGAAGFLGITAHTVDTHRRRAMRKLGVTQQAQAVAMLARAGAPVSHRRSDQLGQAGHAILVAMESLRDQETSHGNSGGEIHDLVEQRGGGRM